MIISVGVLFPGLTAIYNILPDLLLQGGILYLLFKFLL
jgi:hypothetical protein